MLPAVALLNGIFPPDWNFSRIFFYVLFIRVGDTLMGRGECAAPRLRVNSTLKDECAKRSAD